MLLKLENVFDQDKLENIRSFLSNAKFVDGKFTAGSAAQRVKNNLELDAKGQQADYLDRLIMTTLASNEDFRNSVLPHQVAQPVFARYTQGMHYGDHIDDPVMGMQGARFRTDVALTVFLNEPDQYQGGELMINTTYGCETVKLAAGDVVVYPAASIHRVNEVTEGERLVAVTWIQSLIRSAEKRELLYELNKARTNLMQSAPDSDEAKQVDHSYVNLVRMWSEV